jgi:hypothetical protein
LAAFLLLGYSAGHLGLTLFTPSAFALDEPVVVSPSTLLDTAAVPVPADNQWPALFGTYDPQPPGVVKAVKSKEVQSSYRLKGLFSGQISKWAIIESEAGEFLIREGDTLSEGETVLEINDAGVTIEVDSVQSVINFEDN